MKHIIAALIGFIGPMLAIEPFKFEMTEPVQIKEAESFLIGDRDGVSVSVVLQDADGNERFVHYMTKDAGAEFGGGMLSYRTDKNEKAKRFPNGSPDEKRLLTIIRSACVTSFGISNAVELSAANGSKVGKDGFRRMAMGALLRHFPLNAEQPGAAQPATQPADKPTVKNQPPTPTSKDAPR